MATREVWVHEAKGSPLQCSVNEQTAIHAAMMYGEGEVARYTPDPIWRKFDPENPPEPGWYLCSVRFGIGSQRVVQLSYTVGGFWSRCGDTDYHVLRYTDMPQPPEE